MVRKCTISLIHYSYDKSFRSLLWPWIWRNKGLHPKLCVAFGLKRIIPYLYEMNRFMMIDEQSHNVFKAYVSFYSKIYKNAKLEIQLFE